MCIPCGPRWSGSPGRPRTGTYFYSLESYLKYCEDHPDGPFEDLSSNLRNAENYRTVLSRFPQVFPYIHQKYQSNKMRLFAEQAAKNREE